jgi:aspartate aminotransferase-like enzyme
MNARANFSTGPVAVSDRVRDAFAATAISHRSEAFIERLFDTKRMLKTITGARHIAIACGSGTLANEIVAQQIKTLDKPGLIMVNGEFGERLCSLAGRAGLAFDRIDAPWGARVDLELVRRQLASNERYGWLWCVATETSTGARVDLTQLKGIASEHKLALCLDCMSAIGLVELNLRDVHLASASSGKGLSSVAGLALVFANAPAPSRHDIPASLDLALYLSDHNVPFTMPSALLSALHASLYEISSAMPERFTRVDRDTHWFRNALLNRDLHPLIDNERAAPGVITIALPTHIDAYKTGQRLRECGVDIGFESSYLRERNWIQVALMGCYDDAALRALPKQIFAAITAMAANTVPSYA